LLANTLKILSTTTRNAADHLALKPTATITQAARPMTETNTRTKLHSPWRTNPRNRKINNTRPVRRKLCERLNDEDAFYSKKMDSLFSAIVLRKSGKACKYRFSGYHRIAENHEKATNDTQVAKEKVHVKDEAVTETLNDDDSEKTSDRVFGIPL
jgi:hypothetical protein